MTGVASCPKSMVYGPCGGVLADGGCEVGGQLCPFVTRPLRRWEEPSARPAPGAPDPFGTGGRAVVIGELPDWGTDPSTVHGTAEVLAGHLDAVLFGDTNWDRVRLPPSYRAAAVHAAGLVPWPGLNCRDRNRVALESELAALAAIPVGGVHCVTGDHPALGHRPDAAAVFDLDSTHLAGLAAGMGLTVSVAATPSAPPVAERAARLAEKVRAGARVAILQPMADVESVAAFLAEIARQPARPESVLASVPIVTSRATLERFGVFGGSHLPARMVSAALGDDPRGEGVSAAIDCAHDLIGLEGIAGVVLGLATTEGTEFDDARAIVEVAAVLREDSR